MTVRDAGNGPAGQGLSRFNAVLNLLDENDQKLLKDLGKRHVVKIYSFDRNAREIPVGAVDLPETPTTRPTTAPAGAPTESPKVEPLRPTGESTQVLASIRSVLEELQGQRLAGVVLLTDGRDVPAESLAENLAAIKGFDARIYPVSVGGEKPPRNLAVESVTMEEAAFTEDMVSARVNVRGTGFDNGHQATILLKDQATGMPPPGRRRQAGRAHRVARQHWRAGSGDELQAPAQGHAHRRRRGRQTTRRGR